MYKTTRLKKVYHILIIYLRIADILSSSVFRDLRKFSWLGSESVKASITVFAKRAKNEENKSCLEFHRNYHNAIYSARFSEPKFYRNFGNHDNFGTILTFVLFSFCLTTT